MVQHAFDEVINIPAPQQKLVVDAILWGAKHTDRELNDLVGLSSIGCPQALLCALTL